ncbi:hypothetical protein BJ166DRAFT_17846 [Pestalotiopsis sp. NC0098]|nr:hypothetical protein BJ166DRAFT_17846 [Pestalotiopsis sp. NC0098]
MRRVSSPVSPVQSVRGGWFQCEWPNNSAKKQDLVIVKSDQKGSHSFFPNRKKWQPESHPPFSLPLPLSLPERAMTHDDCPLSAEKRETRQAPDKRPRPTLHAGLGLTRRHLARQKTAMSCIRVGGSPDDLAGFQCAGCPDYTATLHSFRCWAVFTASFMAAPQTESWRETAERTPLKDPPIGAPQKRKGTALQQLSLPLWAAEGAV